MDKSLARLRHVTLARALAGQHPPAFLHDGGGLYLKITPSGTSWMFRYTLGDKRQKIGLGGLRLVSAAAARKLAEGYRDAVALNLDPKVQQRRAAATARSSTTTFKMIAEQVLAEIDKSNLHPVTKQGWRQSLRDHVYPKIGHLILDEIDREKILGVLRPLWPTINQTARNVRQRIETVFDEARDKGLTERPNPARWLDLRRGLGAAYAPKKKPKPHAAMPWQEVPEFYRRLKAQDGYTPRALMFTILTAGRIQESVGARFDEFRPGDDRRLPGGIWTVPAERMKGKPGERDEHVVPITTEMAAIVEEMNLVRRGPCLFPSRFNRDEPLSRSSIALLLTKLGVRGDATTHGFRSSFKDWVSDNGLNDEAGERALAHKVQGVKGHYDRTKMLAMRQDLMQRWTDFVTGRTVMAKPSAGPALQLIEGGRT